MRWSGAGDARPDGAGLRTVLQLPPGAAARPGVGDLATGARPGDPPDPERTWTATEAAWRERCRASPTRIAPRDARHAYAVLRGLTTHAAAWSPQRPRACPNGPSAAATTTTATSGSATSATPDRPSPPTGRTRCWTTPSRFVSRATARRTARTSRPPTPSTASTVPDQHDAGPARLPRRLRHASATTSTQFQLDAFGEALLLFAAAARHDRLDTDHWRAADARGRGDRAALERARRRASGSCDDRPVDALPADLRRRAARRSPPPPRPRATPRLEHPGRPRSSPTPPASALHPYGRWQRAPDDERVDAALLLPAVRGARARRGPTHDRDAGRGAVASWPATATSTASATTAGRSAHAEGAFLLCGFMMALADHQQGNDVAARPLVRTQPGRLRAAGPASPRSSTWHSANCAATSPRRSCTPCCSRRRSGWVKLTARAR